MLHSIAGMRVTTERRAGVADSFLDATLIDEVDVLRGPASTWYGRRGVDAIEHATNRASGSTVRSATLRDGEEDEAAAFGGVNFSGTTGRGQVIGNPDLEEERSLDVELALRRVGHVALASSLYRNQIDDYVERLLDETWFPSADELAMPAAERSVGVALRWRG